LAGEKFVINKKVDKNKVSTVPKLLDSGDFVHLHNHTQYSLLDGLTKIPALVDEVKAMGMDSVAMTDHGTLSGAIEFYKTCKEKGVKPIIGIEAYVSPRRHTDKSKSGKRNYI
jgi:DNA polymerase-3 subunit alpha